MLFLAKPSPSEHPASRQARERLRDTRDFKGALEYFPSQLRFERVMLGYLAEKPSDFFGAFLRLPTRLQQLFVQAHQSFLFNRFLSERLKRGFAVDRAEVGDFVVGVERSGLPLTKMPKMATPANEPSVNAQVKAGKMRVALPIVGLKPRLSLGVMGEIEAEILKKEGIELGKVRGNPLSMAGGAGGLRTAVAPVAEFESHVSAGPDGDECEAELSFFLQRGSYATVLLREIMKPADPLSAGF